MSRPNPSEQPESSLTGPSEPSDALRLVCVTGQPTAPSFQQRVLHYLPGLAQRGIEVELRNWPSGYLAQRRLLNSLEPFDIVWWHRRLLFARQRAMLRRARAIVFDFDDPICFSSRSGGRRSLTRSLRFAGMLKRCDVAVAASGYLADLAKPYCRQVVILPMAVDLPDENEAPAYRPGPTILLWLGSKVTQPYLEQIRPALESLGSKPQYRNKLSLRVVGHEPVAFNSLKVDFRKWSVTEQELALRQCHLGLCPMPDTIWTRGKCPYKVLQYMMHRMPWVGSAVGENLVMADDGQRGLCATATDQWLKAIEALINDEQRRAQMGRAGRDYVIEHHQRERLTDRLVATFRQVVARVRAS